MDILQIILWSLGPILIIGAAIPLMPEQIWWLRAWTYARLQVFFLSLITLSIYLLTFGVHSWIDGIFVSGLAISIFLCLRDIMPFMPGMPKQSVILKEGERHTPVSLFVANVLMENDRHDDLLAMIDTSGADFIFLVETDEKWKTALRSLEEKYPHSYLLPLPEHNGMLVYSRFPIESVQERYLVQDHIPSLTFELQISENQRIKIFGVHPRPPRPQDDTEDLDDELLIIAREAADCRLPAIVTGDLNDVGWSSTTKRFLSVSGLQDPRRGRALYNSFNAKHTLVRWPLDHLFHSDHFSLIEIQRMPEFGSDHFPLKIKLALRQ